MHTGLVMFQIIVPPLNVLFFLAHLPSLGLPKSMQPFHNLLQMLNIILLLTLLLIYTGCDNYYVISIFFSLILMSYDMIIYLLFFQVVTLCFMLARTKHIEIDYHFVQEKVARKDIIVRYISSKDQVVNLYTKSDVLQKTHD